jgi:hypothetical protein
MTIERRTSTTERANVDDRAGECRRPSGRMSTTERASVKVSVE